MCTLEKKGNLFILTITGDGEHRLNPTLIAAIRAALRQVSAAAAAPSSALITTAHGKFFSNGYDLAWANSDTSRILLMDSELRLLIADLVALPMPTVAAVTGHASAAGFVLAMAHDYVLMRRDRGFLYMSELDIGLVVPAWFFALLRCKASAPAAWREVVMTAAKLTAEKGVELGIVDSAHVSAEATVAAAVGLGEELVKRKWNGKVYCDNRRIVLADFLAALPSTGDGDRGRADSVAKSLSKL